MQEMIDAYLRISMQQVRARDGLPRKGGCPPSARLREVRIKSNREDVLDVHSEVGQNVLSKLSYRNLPAFMT